MRNIPKKEPTVLHHYDEHHLPVSATIIVPMIMELYAKNMGHKIESVIDIGCGLGQWLYVFKKEGVSDVVGIDGEHLLSEKQYISANEGEFIPINLLNCNELHPLHTYDLAISLEVGEHLPDSIANDYVSLLTRCSDTILFSAAIPNQTGENHINEQFHQYWFDKFIEQGYYMLDIIRPIIWNNNVINWWYRQNMFLCVKRDSPFFDERCIFDGRQLVHPELLLMYVHMLDSICEKSSSPNNRNVIQTFAKKIYGYIHNCFNIKKSILEK